MKLRWSTKFSVAGRETANLVNANNFLPVETGFFSPEITCLLVTPDFEDHISCVPLGTLVSLAFKDDFVSFRHTRQNVKGVLCSVVHDFCTAAMVANLNDDFTLPVALVTTANNAKRVQHKLRIA